MLVRSSFKDYYDHIGHVYGGGDPSIQYIRKRLREVEQGTERYSTFEVVQEGIRHTPYGDADNLKYKWLSVVGRYYLLVGTKNDYDVTPDWQIASFVLHPQLFKKIEKHRWFRGGESKNYVGEFSPKLVELSRKLNAPVFTFELSWKSKGALRVFVDVPILANIGMPKLVPAEQMYQDLSYFLGNIIKESPDMTPSSKMSDKEKIVGHGFDLKQSFRHRV